MQLETLDPARPAERDRVAALFGRCEDHFRLHYGRPATRGEVDEIFDDAPPGTDPARSVRLGLTGAGGALDGLVELGFGFPEPSDAYLGLLLLAPEARGQGQGARLLSRVIDEARARGAGRLFLAVIEANPRGRAFWERQGFVVVHSPGPKLYGEVMQTPHRMMRPIGS